MQLSGVVVKIDSLLGWRSWIGKVRWGAQEFSKLIFISRNLAACLLPCIWCSMLRQIKDLGHS